MNASTLSHTQTVKNYFTLLGLPVVQCVDETALALAYQNLQKQVHPDRFAQANDADKRIAMQQSVYANEAYKTLRDPLTRAAYLCELHGVPVSAERHAAMPPGFLVQQLEWREALAEAQADSDEAAIEGMSRDVNKVRNEWLVKLAALLDEQHDYTAAAQQVRALMFIDKFSRDVADALDALTT